MMDAETYDEVRKIKRALGDLTSGFDSEKYKYEDTVSWRLWRCEMRLDDLRLIPLLLLLVASIAIVPQLIGWAYSEASSAKYSDVMLLEDTEHWPEVVAAMNDGMISNTEFRWLMGRCESIKRDRAKLDVIDAVKKYDAE